MKLLLDAVPLLQIMGISLIILVIDKVLKVGGKDDMAVLVNIAGIIIIMTVVIYHFSRLFSTIKTLFQM
ncbi:MAG: SpoIIIAC/SpoIIIAD family protein [Clostridiaceae bacterium]